MKADLRVRIFETMPVKAAIIRQIVPAVVSQLIVLIYNLADTFFVGMLNEPRQTAAITVSFPSFMLLTAVSNLFGVGGASVISGLLGKQQAEQAKQAAAVSIWFGIGSAVLFSVLYAIFGKFFLRLCGATAEIYPVAAQYCRFVIVLGGPFVILNTLLSNLVRADGNAFHASLGVSLGGIVNVILDPFFILPQFVNMGAAGAGLATAVSNFLAVAYFTCYLLRNKKTVVVNADYHRLIYIKNHIRPILGIGLASGLQSALTVVAISAQSLFVSAYGTEAVAALGIVKKLDQLPLSFSIGVANGLLPFLAYNYASGNQARRARGFRFGCTISVGFALFCFILYELFAPRLAVLFIRDATTVRYAASFLRIMVTAMPFMAFCYPMIIQFQAMGKIRESMITSIIRKGVLDVPLLFLTDALLPLYGCMAVQPIVDFSSLIVCAFLYRRL